MYIMKRKLCFCRMPKDPVFLKSPMHVMYIAVEKQGFRGASQTYRGFVGLLYRTSCRG